jgi:hypothetical protein
MKFARSVDIRGNTDESWRRGLDYLLRNYLLREPLSAHRQDPQHAFSRVPKRIAIGAAMRKFALEQVDVSLPDCEILHECSARRVSRHFCCLVPSSLPDSRGNGPDPLL